MSTTTPPAPKRGHLIIIEGLDRSGKSTQCQHLQTRAQTDLNFPTILLKFPDRTTPTGHLINSYLTQQTTQDDHAIHLLFSANRWEARSQILATLATGTSIIVDRYSFSGAVYSAAKANPDLGLEWAWAMEVGLPRPDLVVFLDLEEEVARERGGWGEERYERVDMQRRVRALYKELFSRVVEVRVRVVDAGDAVGEVAERVWECFEDVVQRENGVGEGNEVGKLVGLRSSDGGSR